MMKRFTFLCLLILPFVSWSQPRLTLQEAINIALKNNFDIQLAQNSKEIASVNNSYGVAGGLPIVSGTATDQQQLQNIRVETPAGDPRIANGAMGNNLNVNVNGSIVLFNGMKVSATKKRLELIERQNQEILTLQIQQTVAEVMISYYTIIRQQEYLKSIEKTFLTSESKLNIVQNQQKVGLSNNTDLFQAQVDFNSAKQAIITQQLIVSQAITDFMTLLNANSSYSISDSIVVDTTFKATIAGEYMEKHPAMIAAGMQVQINQQLVKETEAQRYPSLRLNAGASYNRAQSDGGFFLLNQTMGPYVSASLNVPIYNGNSFKKQQQIAQINSKSAEIQKASVMRNYQSNAQKMEQSYQSAVIQLATAVENAALAAKLLDLVLKKLELKQATILEVKQAQQSAEQANYQVVNLRFAAKMAEIELKRLSNMLGVN